MAYVMSHSRGSPGFPHSAFSRAAVAAAAHSVQAHRVYVGNLPYAVGWQELKDFMREAGEVSFAEVLLGPDGRSKGCGVVEFSTGEAAQKAITELTDKNLFGRPVFIREDRESQARYGHHPPRPLAHGSASGSAGRQLYITGLPSTVTWQTLKDTFQAAGTVLKADINDGKGTAIVLMSTEAEAANAITTFNGSSLEGSTIQVREDRHVNITYSGAGPRAAAIDPATQTPSTQVFVNNIPYSTTSAELLALSPNATKAEVLAMGSRSKGMGVLEFASLEASAEALVSLQGHPIDGRQIMVKYNERWHDFTDQAVSSDSS